MKLAAGRRGLAASAVAALAITGLTITASPAQAAEDELRLISQLGLVLSTRPDGSFFDDEVRLVAKVRETGPGIEFEVNTNPRATDGDPGWTELEVSTWQEGEYVAAEWSPTEDRPELVGTTVALRVVADNGLNPPTYSTLHDVAITPPHADAHSIHTEEFSGGYFVQPYASTGRTATLVGIHGTTSATDGAVTLQEWNPSAGAYRTLTQAAVSPTDIKVASPDDVFEQAGGEFDAVLPLSVFDAEVGDGVAVRATRETDDVAIGTVQEQAITEIDWEDPEATSAGTTVDLEVTGTNGGRVAGAEVRRADNTLVGYTNGAGRVTVTQPHDTTETYHVNIDDRDAFDPGEDFSVEFTAEPFTREPTGLKASFADGVLFDDQEYAAGDVTLQVVDQDGQPFAGAREVMYRVYPHAAAPPEAITATTDAAGRLVVPFNPAGPDGQWRLEHALEAEFPEYRRDFFVAGDATLSLTPGAGQVGPGGQLTYTGRLTVAGRPLAGRAVSLAYGRGTELAPGNGADAGIVVGGARTRSATTQTGADGTFSVTVDDPAEKGGPSEVGGRLTATVTTAGATATATAEFGTRGGAVRLRGHSKGASADRLAVVGAAVSAGERVRVWAKVGKKWKAVKTAKLNRRGRASLTVKDRNGAKATSYVVELPGSDRGPSKVKRLK